MSDTEAQFPELEELIASGIARGDTHMLVMYDYEDFDHFAAYVRPGETVEKKADRLLSNAYYQLVAVFDLSGRLEEQLADYRARYYGG